MAWTEKDIPDLSGRTAVVTGANGGLGLQTALALAGAGAHVVLAARDPAKTEAAEKRIRASHPSASLEVVPLDLGDLSVVSAAASTILAAHERVDLLVNNAGVMAMPQRTTVDGFEMQFGVDHLGHWAFTAHLLPALLRAPAARVVTVTSTARHRAFRRWTRPTRTCGRTTGRGRRTRRRRWPTSTSGWGCSSSSPAPGCGVEPDRAPGLSNTDLQARTVREGGAGKLGPFFEVMTARSGMSAFEGARPQIRAATDPRAKGGELYAPRFGSTARPCAGRSCVAGPAEADRRPLAGLRARDRHCTRSRRHWIRPADGRSR